MNAAKRRFHYYLQFISVSQGFCLYNFAKLPIKNYFKIERIPKFTFFLIDLYRIEYQQEFIIRKSSKKLFLSTSQFQEK